MTIKEPMNDKHKTGDTGKVKECYVHKCHSKSVYEIDIDVDEFQVCERHFNSTCKDIRNVGIPFRVKEI